ncbi:hypothetical protein GPM19_10385 [Halomonas sp. ZH2S]|uniref:Transposase DDE domain-containing protein n=1 Tax=Vreelandella zhuhanensis TaxID=2684210 RepID=A0A7X3H140_9GAMM|nr:hypothetical protein [Halomonas zhuhanensis]MWJ28608.1 hypothetical protein [Halomonas zhuhanensis]
MDGSAIGLAIWLPKKQTMVLQLQVTGRHPLACVKHGIPILLREDRGFDSQAHLALLERQAFLTRAADRDGQLLLEPEYELGRAGHWTHDGVEQPATSPALSARNAKLIACRTTPPSRG